MLFVNLNDISTWHMFKFTHYTCITTKYHRQKPPGINPRTEKPWTKPPCQKLMDKKKPIMILKIESQVNVFH